MFQNVLILSASAGAGHVRAAQALEKAFALDGRAAGVRHFDTLEHTSAAFRKLYAQAYLDMIRVAPTALGWLYDRLDKPFRNEKARVALNKFNTRRFVATLDELKPDIAVCTHFLPAEIISRQREKGLLTCKLAIVVTDLDVHAMWLVRNYDHYFVALDETREHLLKLGVPADKITITGIPIDPAFTRPKDRLAMRRKHGLEERKTTLLLSAGGFGVGPIENLMRSILELRHDAQVLAICGRNEKLRETLQAIVDEAGRANPIVKVIGYTTQMDELMAAADLIVGKPGGLTTSEALASGVLPVIVNPIPGQEERNADHLLEEGIAIRCNNLQTLAFKIDRLLDDPERMNAMRERARQFARPHAARDIVQAVGRLAGGGGESSNSPDAG
jgi:processive 1,2-diacylglycerol beta-glucosyltransferase